MDGDAVELEPRAATRTSADACAVLVELGRSLKGWQFYRDDAQTRRELLDRAFLALQGELRRNGPLAFEVRREALWLAGSNVAVGIGRVDELARHLAGRGIARIAFEPELDAETLGALLGVLTAEPDAIAATGGPEAALYSAPRSGLHVNGADGRAPAMAVPAPPTAPILLEEPEDAGKAGAREATAGPAPEALELEVELEPEAGAPTAAPVGLLEPVAPVSIDDAPLDADPTTARALELVERLRELTECANDHRYRDLAHGSIFAAQSLVEEGALDEGYRALRVLAMHAGDEQKRSFAQRETAAEGLRQLAHGGLLDDLVRRACECEGDASLHATDVLRQIGCQAAPHVLDRLETEIDSERRVRLSSALLAMGAEAVPALVQAIDSGRPRRQRLALKMAGEMQDPQLVPNLRGPLFGGGEGVAREAALALARIRDVSSLETLAEALATARPEVASFAAYALGSSGRVLAAAPLADALARAVEAGQLRLAREVIRALGRLARPEAVPALASLVARGGLFQRRKLRDLKLAAVTALANLPGHESAEALSRAARSSDAQVRRVAALALRRRVPDAPRGAAGA